MTARGRLDRRELLLLRVFCSGEQGLGEAAPLSLRGGPSVTRIAREIDERCRSLIDGAEIDIDDPWSLSTACERSGISRQALAAVELALIDLCGKLSGRPAWALLGATRAHPVPCNATLPAGAPAVVAQRSLRWARQGFSSFKLKVGLNGDREQVEAVREALGPQARLRVDANAAWTAAEASVRLGELEPFDIELIEQPAATLGELATVRQGTSVPITADESIVSAADARQAVEIGACDAATVKIAKVGGIRTAREIVETLPVYLSSALDGPVGIAAAAHLAQVLPPSGFAGRLAHGLATGELFADTIASSACEVVNAAITPAEVPGFGVEIDQGALERCHL